MKIATYNIWASDIHFDERLKLLCKTINESDVDIIGLQEVRDEEVVNQIKKDCEFPYAFWKKYDDYEEGLVLFSKYPIIYEEINWGKKQNAHYSFAMRTVIEYNNLKIGVTNLHLESENVLNRETAIVEIVKMIESYQENDFEILLGDFNDSPGSSIHRYLTSQQSLGNHATTWMDLAKSFAAVNNTEPEVTLDFHNNPRWDHENVIEVPERYDWILLKYPYPKKNPKLEDVRIIGNERVGNITPSDHYGLISEMEFN